MRTTPPRGDLLSQLRTAFPDLHLITDLDILESYRRDQAQFVDAGMPLTVAFPRSASEVQELVRFAAADKLPIVPRGAGSGLSGGANAIDGCLVICLDRMNQILDIDASNLTAVVQPGVLNADLKREVASHGLYYPPDPASSEFSTIGGNIATNAGGLCCLKYGVTGDFVLGLEVIQGDGTSLRTGRRTRKGVAGYDLTRLFVGSEGTLGIVTEATLRLRPAPLPASTLIATFPTLDGAGRAISAIVSKLVPSMLELLDRHTLQAIEEWRPLGVGTAAEALLIARSDDSDSEEQLAVIENLCVDSGADLVARSTTAEEAEMLLEARRLAFPSLERKGNVMLDDVAVPPSRIASLLREISEIADRNSVLIGTFGHAGDGNLHPTIVFDGLDPSSLNAARTAFDEIVKAALDLGGTITGEHGVGLLKRQYLRAELGDTSMRLHAALKEVLDPAGILNPGKGF